MDDGLKVLGLAFGQDFSSSQFAGYQEKNNDKWSYKSEAQQIIKVNSHLRRKNGNEAERERQRRTGQIGLRASCRR